MCFSQPENDDSHINSKKCKQCSILLSKDKKDRKFCSRSCSVTYNNRKRKNNHNTKCLYCNNLLLIKNRTYCNSACHNNYKKDQKFKDVISGTANAKQVKKYLIETHGNICLSKDCAWDFSKKSINVELEHIDGDSTNNSLSNTTLLCPNCHSTTSTYKGKNKGNGRYFRRERYNTGKSY